MAEITFRAVIEVLGKPKEHVEEALKGYVEKLKKDKNFQVLVADFAEAQQQEKQELWSTFVELEVKIKQVQNLTDFCFEYMPSMIEVIEPAELAFSEGDLSMFLGNLMMRLHKVDMVAKEVKFENDYLARNMGILLKNYVLILLTKGDLTSEQLSKLTGVGKEKLEDYLDKLIDEKKIDLKEGRYYLVKEMLAENKPEEKKEKKKKK